MLETIREIREIENIVVKDHYGLFDGFLVSTDDCNYKILISNF